MIKNYLKVALRNLWKNKGFTAINVIGLAAGLGVCLLIVLYVLDERSYDRYNVKVDRIYRLDADIFFNNTQFDATSSPKPMAPALMKDYPEIEQIVRINNNGDVMVKKGADWVQDHHKVLADSTFFQVFSIPMIAGNPATALNEPHSVVIDETVARRYFNSTDVIGKTLEMENKNICKVTGVIKDMPAQSHFHFSFIEPLRDGYQGDENDWLSNNYSSYILVRPGTDRALLQRHLDATVNNYLGKQLSDIFHATLADMKHQGAHFDYHLMPLSDIHLHSNKSYEFEPNGNINFVYIFSIIAGLIMLIACVNFMNLSTARSANRAKEVGIRKVAGSTKTHLIVQFLTESILVSLFSLVLAIGLALALLPMFNTLAGKHLDARVLFSARILPLLILLVVVVGFLAGSYPAFYLSSFQPIKVLKGKIASGFKSSWLRSGLVVFQFGISIMLIIGTIVIYRQLNFIRSREIGFNREQVLVIHNAYTAGDPIKTFRQDVVKLAGVSDATLTGDLPTKGDGYSQNGWFRDQAMDAKSVTIATTMFVDDHFVPTLGMKMVKGRNFSIDEFPSDSTAIIVNESAAGLLAMKDPLTEKLYRPRDNAMHAQAWHIIGVVRDFNFNSMHEKVRPLIMQFSDARGFVAIRLKPGNAFSTVGSIEASWKKMAPGLPFAYTFMDNDFDKLYHTEAQTGQLFITFAVFAILIACLGLFGLVTYAAEQRTKEIGIRKVLGAKVGGIVSLLSKDFTRLVVIAALIAFPVAWWGCNFWLQGFAYRVGISWWIFVVAGLTALAIALLTVSVQTIRAALANPVQSLRSE